MIKFSFNDLIYNEKKDAKSQMYMVNLGSHLLNFYFCMQRSTIYFDNQESTMLQFIDMSEGQRLEEMVRKKNFATMLNATVSHEMRTPINSIQQSVIAYKNEIDEIKDLKNELSELLSNQGSDPE
jgi:signal transduction histidine kinase